MDRTKTLNNLFALIDSGKEENLEMALQLSVNLAPEWKWVHTYLQARNALPKGYVSWYQVYAKAVKLDHECVCVPVITSGKIDHQTYTMTEIHQRVAIELHYILFGLDRPTLIDEAANIRSVLNQMGGHLLPRSNMFNIANRIIGLLPR